MACRVRAVVGLVVMLPAVFVLSAGGEREVATATATVAVSMAEAPILLTGRVADPHQAGVMWFSVTGHTLRGAFLEYWQRYGGLAQFGYPLTEEFYEPLGPPPEHQQYLVQYFERNRFELHPENAGTPYEVLLGTLGREFHQQDPPASALPGATYFPQTGHNLSGVFTAYWEGHGGLFVHGYPITEQSEEESPTDHKMYLVQYFERSRFEWHPENAGSEYEVLLGLLGRQLSEKKGYPYGWYPLYGRAGDWSWVAGRVQLHVPPTCAKVICGCSLMRFDGRAQEAQPLDFAGDLVQMTGPGWFDPALAPEVRQGAVLVVFGRVGPVEGSSGARCFADPQAPPYQVGRVQSNPAQPGGGR